jgi:predicted kinase
MLNPNAQFITKPDVKYVFLTVGLQASGKTTWAEKFLLTHSNYRRVNRDLLRRMAFGGEVMAQKTWKPKQEKLIVEMRDLMIMTYLKNGHSVIVDDTNLNPKILPHIQDLVCAGFGPVIVEQVDFTDVPLYVCLERDKNRQNWVGEEVIKKTYYQYLCQPPQEKVWGEDLPKIIVCDLDGTLAEIGDRDPYDASKCELDTLNGAVYDVLYSLESRYPVVLISGRQEKDRLPTERWLVKHQVPYTALYMRETGDTRPDDVVKKELYEQHIKDKYFIHFVLDDRTRVVNLWRNLGYKCFQVAPHDF